MYFVLLHFFGRIKVIYELVRRHTVNCHYELDTMYVKITCKYIVHFLNLIMFIIGYLHTYYDKASPDIAR